MGKPNFINKSIASFVGTHQSNTLMGPVARGGFIEGVITEVNKIALVKRTWRTETSQ